jgi:5'-deoxynucleotidase YfbR-like HD superfamily hydrolase
VNYETLLQNIIHAANTHRWHQHQQLGGTHETVAHHSTITALLAHYLVSDCDLEQLTGTAGRYAVMLACLTHDLGEYWVGDVPSPTKRKFGMSAQLDQVEAQERLYKLHLPTDVLTVEQQCVIHLSDCLAGSLHCWNQLQLGNAYARRPLEEYKKYILQYVVEQTIESGRGSFDAARLANTPCTGLETVLRKAANFMEVLCR